MGRSAFWAVLVCLSLLAGPAVALRIVVISDLNGSYGSTSYSKRIPVAIQRIIEMKPDLVISTGDMVAGQRKPVLGAGEVRAMWAAFHRVVSDPLAQAGIPLAVTPGNHDASAYGGFEGERKIFGEEWRARKPDLRFLDGADYPFFYAFEMERRALRFAGRHDARTPARGSDGAPAQGDDGEPTGRHLQPPAALAIRPETRTRDHRRSGTGGTLSRYGRRSALVGAPPRLSIQAGRTVWPMSLRPALAADRAC